jgi:hypothetical protein
MDEELILLLLTAIVAAGTIVLVYLAMRSQRTAPEQPATAQTDSSLVLSEGAGQLSLESTSSPVTEPLYEGVVAVAAGGHEAIPLILNTGDRVRGVVKESEGYLFSALLMSERSYSRYSEGSRPRSLWSHQDVSSATIDVTVAHEGTFYLVLDLYGKQLDRDISVRLRRTTAA